MSGMTGSLVVASEAMMPRHRAVGHVLVKPQDVAAAGFSVAPASVEPRHVVLYREIDGWWTVLDQSEISDLPLALQERAISIAVAVMSGINALGATVTSLDVAEEVRWIGLWQARHWLFACRCNRRLEESRKHC